MISLQINGEIHQIENAQTIADVLKNLNLEDRRVAVMLNEKIVRKETFEQSKIEDNDKIEIIQMVGGG